MAHPPEMMNILQWQFALLLIFAAPLVLVILNLLLKRAGAFFFVNRRPGEEQRKHPRFIPYEGTLAEVSFGTTRYFAQVHDISRFGISLSNLSGKPGGMTGVRVVIRGFGSEHVLKVQPRWVSAGDQGIRMGGVIEEASPDWSQFLLQTEKICPSLA